MEAKCYRAMRRAQGKMLREYFSGVSVESLSRRYGYSVIKIKTLASDYKQGKIDIFDDPQKRKIATSIMTHQEEVQLLRDKIRALENALKLSNIKAEGYEVKTCESCVRRRQREHRAFVRAKARFAGQKAQEHSFVRRNAVLQDILPCIVGGISANLGHDIMARMGRYGRRT